MISPYFIFWSCNDLSLTLIDGLLSTNWKYCYDSRTRVNIPEGKQWNKKTKNFVQIEFIYYLYCVIFVSLKWTDKSHCVRMLSMREWYIFSSDFYLERYQKLIKHCKWGIRKSSTTTFQHQMLLFIHCLCLMLAQ